MWAIFWSVGIVGLFIVLPTFIAIAMEAEGERQKRRVEEGTARRRHGRVASPGGTTR